MDRLNENPSKKRRLNNNGIFKIEIDETEDTEENSNIKRNQTSNIDTIKKALGIELIFEKILGDSKDFKSLMALRLICQSFNRGCLQIMEKSFRKILIEIDESEIPEDLKIYNKWDHILINGIDLKISSNKELNEFLPFIKFLKNEVGVKVKQLKLKGLYKLDNKYYNGIHDAIINELIGKDGEKLIELIGMEDICPLGCRNCTNLVERCQKYGPIQLQSFMEGLKKPQNFKELIMSDNLLYRIAEKTIDTEKSKEEEMESMKSMIPAITCDHLIIIFTEPDTDTCTKKVLPYECLEAIIRSWKPKSIGLEIHAPRGSRITQTNGYPYGYYTELDFDDPDGRLNGLQDLKFSYLEIDISNSKKHLEAFRISYEYGRDRIHILYSNARTIFPTDRMNIILPKEYFGLNETQYFNSYLGHAIFKQPQRNLQVNIQWFAKIPGPQEHCCLTTAVSVDRRFKRISLDENCLRQKYQKMIGLNSNYRKTFSCVQFIGKRYTIRDEDVNSVINMEVWMEKERFENYCHTLPFDVWRGSGYFGMAQELVDPVHKESCLICQGLYNDRHRN